MGLNRIGGSGGFIRSKLEITGGFYIIPIQEIEYKTCSSINNKKLLKIQYKRDSERLIEPYVYGVDKKHHSKLLSAYQISGFSSTGKNTGWKLFNIQNIESMVELDEYFQVRPDYDRRAYDFIKAICKI